MLIYNMLSKLNKYHNSCINPKSKNNAYKNIYLLAEAKPALQAFGP
jgi:hypothetical protein